MRLISALCLIVLSVGATGAAGAFAHPVPFEPPVNAPISDPYRPPKSPYGPGNRGIEYDTRPGQVVASAGAGTVVFSGWVGGRQYVTIDHTAGLRTTYSWLTSRTVQMGDRVQVGTHLGTAGDVFHFGARRDREYIDPALLFESASVKVMLVAIDEPFGRTYHNRYTRFSARFGVVSGIYRARCLAVSDCIAFR